MAQSRKNAGANSSCEEKTSFVGDFLLQAPFLRYPTHSRLETSMRGGCRRSLLVVREGAIYSWAAKPKPCLFFTRSLWLLRLHGAYIWAGSTPRAPQEPHSTIPQYHNTLHNTTPRSGATWQGKATQGGRVGFLNQPAPGVFKSAFPNPPPSTTTQQPGTRKLEITAPL